MEESEKWPIANVDAGDTVDGRPARIIVSGAEDRTFQPTAALRLPFVACHLGSPLASSPWRICSIIRGRSFQEFPHAMSITRLPSKGSAALARAARPGPESPLTQAYLELNQTTAGAHTHTHQDPCAAEDCLTRGSATAWQNRCAELNRQTTCAGSLIERIAALQAPAGRGQLDWRPASVSLIGNRSMASICGQFLPGEAS